MSDYWNLILKIIKLIYKRKENIKMYIKTYENYTNDNKNIDFFLKKALLMNYLYISKSDY